MPAWLVSVLCVEAAAWAAFFAQLGHRHRFDRIVGEPCARVAMCLLIAGTGFFLMHWGAANPPLQRDEAVRTPRTALVTLHAPSSQQALARDPVHRPFDLLPRGAP